MPLTDRLLAGLKPDPARRREYFDTVVSGLALRVNLGGSKTWVLFYRNAGRQRRLTLGGYPAVSLADARKRARRHLNRISDGADPGAEKRQARRAETFGELADDYLEKYAKRRKRSWMEDQRILEKDLLPVWRPRKLGELTRREIREHLEAIAERAPVMGNRTWALVSRIFNWGIERDWIDANPATRITQQPETSRTRVLSSSELRDFWAVLDRARALRRVDDVADRQGPPLPSPMIARGLQVLLLTAQRPGEVFGMRWRDVSLPDDWETNADASGWWTIPETATKNRTTHRVFLTPAVVAILREAKACGPSENPYVFAGEIGASVAARAKKAAAALSRDHLSFSFHRHDLRRTAATSLGEAGYSRDVIAKVLNHVDRGARMTAVYDRYSADREKQAALTTWAARLAAILANQPSSVVPFSRPSSALG